MDKNGYLVEKRHQTNKRSINHQPTKQTPENTPKNDIKMTNVYDNKRTKK